MSTIRKANYTACIQILEDQRRYIPKRSFLISFYDKRYSRLIKNELIFLWQIIDLIELENLFDVKI